MKIKNFLDVDCPNLLRSGYQGRHAMHLPNNGCSLELCIPFLKLTNKKKASISWKPRPLAANVTRNMIGAAANSQLHVVDSQDKGKGMQSSSEQPFVGRGIT